MGTTTMQNLIASVRESEGRVGVSTGKAAELRMKNLEQLRYLQGLYDDNILSDSELVEQKRIVLDALSKLS